MQLSCKFPFGIFLLNDNIRRKWRARIPLNNRKIDLRAFSSETDAAKARDHAAPKYHGDFAALNLRHPPTPA
jgi:hypothetical protein